MKETVNILIIGRDGQVSTQLVNSFSGRGGFDIYIVGKEEIDLLYPEQVYDRLDSLNQSFDFVINAAAYTAVDKAEDEKDICDNINYHSVTEIAKFCREKNSMLLHYSTDYVFNGSGEEPFKEDDIQNLHPLNQYGLSKLNAEKTIINSGCKYMILRTSWVYNEVGGNFVKTILRLLGEKEELKIVDDQVGNPTYAGDIAANTIKIIDNIFGIEQYIGSGIYHFVPSECVSWHQFALMIREKGQEAGFPMITKKITPIISSEFPTRTKRPHNSRLDTEKLRKTFDIDFPSIEKSLTRCLNNIKTYG